MDSNRLIELEKEFVDNLCDDYNYDSNIRHILYLKHLLKSNYQNHRNTVILLIKKARSSCLIH